VNASRLIGAAVLAGASLCARQRLDAQAPPALLRVDAAYRGADGAKLDGVSVYRSLGAALAAAPAAARAPVIISIRDGRYREKLSVDKPFITLVGDSRDRTIITYDAAADTRDANGTPYGTRGSYTLRVTAPDFRAEHLTIENAFDFDANARKAEGDPTKFRNTQGVALATTGASDRAVFEDVRLVGHQDTFFGNAGRHYFHRCIVVGHVDFVFGAGTVVFDDCDIVSLDRGSTTDNGYIAAPSTDAASPFGIVFVRSRLKKGSPAPATGTVSLGRPWHPSATPAAVPAAIYLDCWMDDHISARGWDHMSSVDSTTKVRYWFEPGSARFLEYRSSGPGAVASSTRRVMSDGDARTYTLDRILGGWTPERRP
jgi:Pectin methylesterase